MKSLAVFGAVLVLGSVAVFSVALLGGAGAGGASTGRNLMSSSSSDCNIVEAARDWWHAQQEGDYKAWGQSYHRTALRYENGVLAPWTGGLPYSVEQYTCVNSRADVRMSLKHIGRDQTHKFVGIEYEMFVESEVGVPVYASLEFDRATCKVSVERYYFDAAHVGINKLREEVHDDCFSGLTTGDAPRDDVAVVKQCISYWVNEDGESLANCFTEKSDFYYNGMELPVPHADSWDAAFAAADVEKLEFLQVITHSKEHRVSIYGTYEYTLEGTDDTFLVHFGMSIQLDNHGKFAYVEEVEGTGVLPLLEASMEADAEMAAFTNAEAAMELHDTVDGFGTPTWVSAHSVYWANPAKFCFSEAWLNDELVPHAPRNEFDEPMHNTFLTVNLPVNLDAEQAANVHALSDAFTFNALTHTLTIRTNHYGSAIALGALAMRVADGQSVAAVQQQIGDVVDGIFERENGEIVRNEDGTIVYNDNKVNNLGGEMCNIADNF